LTSFIKHLQWQQFSWEAGSVAQHPASLLFCQENTMARHGLSADDLGSLIADARRWVRFGVIKGIVDGDTFDAGLDLGYSVRISQRFRLYGVNAPERGQPGYIVATMALTKIMKMNLGAELAIVTWRDRRDKYGRYIADFAVPMDGQASALPERFQWASDLMLASGTVEEYLP